MTPLTILSQAGIGVHDAMARQISRTKSATIVTKRVTYRDFARRSRKVDVVALVAAVEVEITVTESVDL